MARLEVRRREAMVASACRHAAADAGRFVAFTALERQLAGPEGDTLVSEPIRRVPRRHH